MKLANSSEEDSRCVKALRIDAASRGIITRTRCVCVCVEMHLEGERERMEIENFDWCVSVSCGEVDEWFYTLQPCVSLRRYLENAMCETRKSERLFLSKEIFIWLQSYMRDKTFRLLLFWEILIRRTLLTCARGCQKSRASLIKLSREREKFCLAFVFIRNEFYFHHSVMVL